ncbi:hypothetical protein HanRHA438_Chr03g0112931 [Helianthus annuus]|nr:hypothetical protein HanIR_Chr03g0111411 [Helianthus annuus]KAJ0934909.1 hypothetical protein HanRHA438_Chr03g0112931 [Helianthus annuus]
MTLGFLQIGCCKGTTTTYFVLILMAMAVPFSIAMAMTVGSCVVLACVVVAISVV